MLVSTLINYECVLSTSITVNYSIKKSC